MNVKDVSRLYAGIAHKKSKLFCNMTLPLHIESVRHVKMKDFK